MTIAPRDLEANPFIIDHDLDHDDPLATDRPHLTDSEDSDSDVDESTLDRDLLEKDSRFLDEPFMEEGKAGEEVDDDTTDQQGYSYPRQSKRSRPRQPKVFIFILSCILLVATAIGILAGHGFNAPLTTYSRKGGTRHLTMDHIFNGTFAPSMENIAWVKEAGDGIYSTRNSDGDIILRSAIANSTERILVTAADIKDPNTFDSPLPFIDWKLSPDTEYLLLKTSYRKLWRHSSFGNYYLHRLSDHSTFPLRKAENPSMIAYAEWSPQGHHVAYVYLNDLYVVPSSSIDFTSNGPIAPSSTRVTSDGSSNIFNGVPDWVYEEEVFQANFALWWNPLGDRIAFLRSDEADVRDYTLQYYNPSGEAMEPEPYPQNFVMKYPKPGTPNPLVTVHSYSLAETGLVSTLTWPGAMPLSDRIILEVAWVGHNDLLVKEVDRAARKGSVVIFENGINEGKVTRVLGQEGEEGDDGWIDHSQNAIPIPGDIPGYLDVVPTKEGYPHIALFAPVTSSEPIWITKGEWEVASGISGVDLKNGIAYFMAANPSMERHLYSARLPATTSSADLDAFQPDMQVLTDATKPGYYMTSFSPLAGHYMLINVGPDVPWQKLIKVGQETLNVIETRPPNIDTSGRKKYPVLLNPYGGPNSQSADVRFRRDWHHYLACEKKIIVLTVDGRGTGLKGRKFRNVIRDDLGRYEVIDQVNAAREWAQKRYVDIKRIGIWGWSYGGFLTSKVIEADSGVISLGMAVAPVTNWLYYDSIYTERYMSTPTDNMAGYISSAVNNVTAFEHSDFLLAHGSGDDNVHYANTANLLEKFTQADVRSFRFRMFTDSNHAMSGRHAFRELYEYLNMFLDEKWGKKSSSNRL
ncbi:hypothetical protein QFC21_001349 [Naganishia friedmannii]|uniref:Uncharacterized protein n=1 Tax=Naganishia friedmannii TaxID=89922 RepID=A0ACC2W4H3_9TREE|nr:hypothetical protein QFC21_001349 [Naganishia friedmannii]